MRRKPLGRRRQDEDTMTTTTLEEVTGGVPRAPRPPAVENILGPPPQPPTAPRVGKRGRALGLVGGLRSGGAAPRPPRVGHQTPRPPAAATPAPQTVVVEQKPYKGNVDYVAQPGKRNPFSPNALAGDRAKRAAAARDKAAPLRNQQPPAPAAPAAPDDQSAPVSPEDQARAQARRAQGWADIHAQMQTLRQPPGGGGATP